MIVFGFAASKSLSDAKVANAGLRDQREAFNCMCFVRPTNHHADTKQGFRRTLRLLEAIRRTWSALAKA